jgi:beta-lactam-binding protein with PASTA domain
LNIRRRGLDVASMADVEAEGVPADQVLAQSPTSNAAQVAAPKISLLVTSPGEPQTFVMPSFVGQALGSASRTLEDAGFRLGNVGIAAAPTAPTAPATEETNAAVAPMPAAPPGQQPVVAQPAPPAQPSPSSIIVTQAPAAGQKVTAGTAVSFEVR